MIRALFFSAAVWASVSTCSLAQGPRIVGGGDAAAGDYPWMTALLQKDVASIFQAQDCGGALVHPYWVVTAAHCVEDRTAEELQVVVGAVNLNAPGLVRRNVAEIIMHPGYRTWENDHDIALLLLAEPVTDVTPLRIINDPALTAAGVMGRAIGWGALDGSEDPSFPSILQVVELPVLDSAVANQADWLNGGVTAGMFAAGFETGGKDTCGGDSGGPFVVRGPGNEWMLGGVVNWGEGCAEVKKPGVYCRVSAYRQWLQSYIWPGFAKWESEAGITNNDGPDVDGDGADQWLEYALRRNPLAVDAGAPVPGFTVFNNQRHATLTVKRPAGGGDIAWGLQGSTVLNGWTVLDAAQQAAGAAQPVAGDAGAEWMTWRGLPEQNGRSFVRSVIAPSRSYLPASRMLSFPGFARHALHALDAPVNGFYVRDYALTGLPAGQSVSLTLRSEWFNTALHLINTATGAVVSSSTANNAGGTNERITFTPAAGTSYAARVTTQTAGATGSFTLALYQVPSGLTTISAGTTRSGSLAVTDATDDFYPGEMFYKDDYLFTPANANVITFLLTSTFFDADLTVIDAETGEPRMAGTGAAGVGGALVTWKPEAGHAYYVRTSSFLPQDTGSYSLRGIATPSVAVDGTATGTLTTTDGLDTYYVVQSPPQLYYADDFIITGATAGAALRATVNSSLFDPTVEILDAETGESVAYDVETGVVDFTAEAGRSYIVRVSTYAEEDTGSYSVAVTLR